ncbi:hypothetical protein LPB140_06895 [Sphingorhabdus lutea]|uniref:Helix-turn-helix domain-containing protein n=1 Tax=Sphingorhabdus lutea TaxID=1913578 RepID=A0A1L3JBN4_9SPHN|nr:excisionase family DNA-binding protein [Sphingorhabdus lutea]APG62555.1 hypothetical protein LPB140_06895 [Sphingorhabdus lutea]
MHKELLTVSEFLEIYSISRTEFYRQVKAGHIRLTKMGNASRVTKADADAWLAALPTIAHKQMGEAA